MSRYQEFTKARLVPISIRRNSRTVAIQVANYQNLNQPDFNPNGPDRTQEEKQRVEEKINQDA